MAPTRDAEVEVMEAFAAAPTADLESAESLATRESDVSGLRAAAGRQEAEAPSAMGRTRDARNEFAPNPVARTADAQTADAQTVLARVALAPIVLPAASEQVSLLVPVVVGVRRSVEVVVSDPTGTRVLRQRAEVAPERAEVAIGLPRVWLAPGQYRVELHDGAAPPSVFSLSVVSR